MSEKIDSAKKKYKIAVAGTVYPKFSVDFSWAMMT